MTPMSPFYEPPREYDGKDESMRTAPDYTAQQTTEHGVAIIRLADAARGVEVSIAPSVGNRAYEMKVRGKNILYMPHADVGLMEQYPDMCGIPFLAPWANRMADGGFWANGRKYAFNPGTGTVQVPANGIVSHGMLIACSDWQVTEVTADADSAYATSRLEFWKYPGLMANWPFAHEYEMTYRLAGGVLEVSTTVVNRSHSPMPLSLGFHPYFNLPEVLRDEALAHVAAKTAVVTDENLIPTGEMKPNDLPDPTPLRDHSLDNGYTGLVRDPDGRATFWIEGRGKKIQVQFGPEWRVAIVWAPPGDNFICFEPMAAITNGVNLAHDGKYTDLQLLEPGATWRESFWVSASGI